MEAPPPVRLERLSRVDRSVLRAVRPHLSPSAPQAELPQPEEGRGHMEVPPPVRLRVDYSVLREVLPRLSPSALRGLWIF